ncbi:MAG TPA: DedA family protein [Anaerolineales bacterium]|nr:DedA family protein [Anaerolineales bacterium]
MPIWLEQLIVAKITEVFQAMGWAGVVAIMVLESANIPIPSEVTMPLAGWLLVQARGGSPLEAALLGGAFGALGCTLGSLLSYGLGAIGGRPLLDRYGKYLMLSRHDLEVADRWFVRWGDWTAFLSRLLPIVRTFISFPAGVSRARLGRFTVYTFLGSFIWCAALAYGGFVFGAHWEELRAWMRPFDIPIAVVLVVGFVYYLIHHVRRGARGRQVTEEPSKIPD